MKAGTLYKRTKDSSNLEGGTLYFGVSVYKKILAKALGEISLQNINCKSFFTPFFANYFNHKAPQSIW
jgi:hypothetical protein